MTQRREVLLWAWGAGLLTALFLEWLGPWLPGGGM